MIKQSDQQRKLLRGAFSLASTITQIDLDGRLPWQDIDFSVLQPHISTADCTIVSRNGLEQKMQEILNTFLIFVWQNNESVIQLSYLSKRDV